jgi:hypothetical protein
MIGAGQLRFWTALSVMGLSAFTIASSINLLAYGLQEPRIDAATANETLAPFASDRTVGFLARTKALELDRSLGAEARIAALSDLLSLTPLSGGAWLELARARLGAGAGIEKAASALAMAKLSAPNEAQAMAARAVFGLPLWRLLPPEDRKYLLDDLIGGFAAMSEPDRDALRAMFAAAGPKMRAEARAAHLVAGRDAAPVLSALGLGPATPASSPQ